MSENLNQLSVPSMETPQLSIVSKTPVDAKNDAIAALTMSAYSKASTLVLTPEEITRLQADFPDSAFLAGAGGDDDLLYLQHAHMRDRLNSIFGPGQWAIIPRNRWAEDFEFTDKYKKVVQAARIYVEAMLIIRGCFVGEAVGQMTYYKNNAGSNYGDAVEGAKTYALRRCCKELGIGLQAWKEEFVDGWYERQKKNKNQRLKEQDERSGNPSVSAHDAPDIRLSKNEVVLPAKWEDAIISFPKAHAGKKLGDIPVEARTYYGTTGYAKLLAMKPLPEEHRAFFHGIQLFLKAQTEAAQRGVQTAPADEPQKEWTDEWKDCLVCVGEFVGKKLADLTHEQRIALFNSFKPKINATTVPTEIHLKKALLLWKAEIEKELND